MQNSGVSIVLNIQTKYNVGDILYLRQDNNGGNIKVTIDSIEASYQLTRYAKPFVGFNYVLNKVYNGVGYRISEHTLEANLIRAKVRSWV